MPRLRHVDCAGPGLTRRRLGSGFSYRDEQGRPIRDAEIVAWRRGLAIPPAWGDVWICPVTNGRGWQEGRRSENMNAFLKGLVGEEFSAKDFRSWHATVLAALGVAAAERVRGAAAWRKSSRRRSRRSPAPWATPRRSDRASYVDPRVFDRYRAGATIDPRLTRVARSSS